MAIYRGGFETCPIDGALLSAVTTDPLVGTVIADQYVVDACVGEGAMGRVYRAHHTRLTKRKFAIKVLLGDLAADPTMRMRFGQEAEAASRLQHPNVVSVLDFGKTESGLNYLVMDFIEGGSLCDRIEQGPLSEAEAIELSKQICQGLTHAHEQGLVHRDFKPDNVALVDHDGKIIPKILDFGLAIISTPEESSVRLTSAGMVVGTPAYVSPEQSQGQTVDQRTDLFALGVSLYEMLSGKLPFDGSIIDVLYKNATEDAPSIAERGSIKVSPELEAIVTQLMARDRDKRFANAREVLTALEGIRSPCASVMPASPLGRVPLGRNRGEVESAQTMAALTPIPPHGDSERAESAMASPGRSKPPLLISALILAIVAVAGAAVFVVASKDSGKKTPTEAANAKSAGTVEPNSEPSQPATVPATPDLAVATSIADAGPKAVADVAAETTADAAPSKAVAKVTPPSKRPISPKNQPIKTKAAKVATHKAAPKEPVKDSASTAKVEAKVVPPGPEPKTHEVVAPKVDPKPKVVTPPKPKVVTPPKPKVPTVFKAATSLASFDSHGSLSDSKVRQSIDPIMSKLAGCYETAARASKANATLAVKVKFIISENARVERVSVSKTPLTGLSSCITKAVKKMRSRGRPDTGPQRVEFTLHYKPKH